MAITFTFGDAFARGLQAAQQEAELAQRQAEADALAEYRADDIDLRKTKQEHDAFTDLWKLSIEEQDLLRREASDAEQAAYWQQMGGAATKRAETEAAREGRLAQENRGIQLPADLAEEIGLDPSNVYDKSLSGFLHAVAQGKYTVEAARIRAQSEGAGASDPYGNLSPEDRRVLSGQLRQAVDSILQRNPDAQEVNAAIRGIQEMGKLGINVGEELNDEQIDVMIDNYMDGFSRRVTPDADDETMDRELKDITFFAQALGMSVQELRERALARQQQRTGTQARSLQEQLR